MAKPDGDHRREIVINKKSVLRQGALFMLISCVNVDLLLPAGPKPDNPSGNRPPSNCTVFKRGHQVLFTIFFAYRESLGLLSIFILT
jgi:hypothetical protein